MFDFCTILGLRDPRPPHIYGRVQPHWRLLPSIRTALFRMSASSYVAFVIKVRADDARLYYSLPYLSEYCMCVRLLNYNSDRARPWIPSSFPNAKEFPFLFPSSQKQRERESALPSTKAFLTSRSPPPLNSSTLFNNYFFPIQRRTGDV